VSHGEAFLRGNDAGRPYFFIRAWGIFLKFCVLSLDSPESMHIYTFDFLHKKSATTGSASKSKTISIIKREV
jgi:hypothetical protein